MRNRNRNRTENRAGVIAWSCREKTSFPLFVCLRWSVLSRLVAATKRRYGEADRAISHSLLSLARAYSLSTHISESNGVG